jgi:hypothetical protein
MVSRFKLLGGLPPYGPLATAFPSDWGRLGREGFVVEFGSGAGAWVANFRPGLGGLNTAVLHPNGHDVAVIASGDLWVVNPERRSAERLLPAIFAALEVQNPNGWILNRQGIALARLGPGGLVWHTRRLSWDGFDQVRIEGNEVIGLAWSPFGHQWLMFRVDLRTGRSTGGTYLESDPERWEQIYVG